LVEDDDGDAFLIVELLAKLGGPRPVVRRMRSLREAKGTLTEADFDVVLLDLTLTDASGVHCVRELQPVANGTPVVVITIDDDLPLAKACIYAGAQDFLSKHDLAADDLGRAVEHAIARGREVALSRRAQRLQGRVAALLEASSDAIVSTDMAGVVTSWNRGAGELFGYAPDEAVGRQLEDLVPPDPSMAPAREGDMLAPSTGHDLGAPRELVRLAKGQRRVDISVINLELRDDAGRVVAVASVCRDVGSRKRHQRAVERHSETLSVRARQMSLLAERLYKVREQERTRIARQVHDELGQLLTGIKLDLCAIERRLETTPSTPAAEQGVHDKLGDAKALIDRTVQAVQTIAIDLRPSALDSLGLAAAVRDEARRFAGRSGLELKLDAALSREPTPEVATALFRVMQELLTNVARHAQATTVGVSLTDNEFGWTLRVMDDGVGITKQNSGRSDSLGLLGVRERVAAIGGAFRIGHGAERGTEAIAHVPLNEFGEPPP